MNRSLFALIISSAAVLTACGGSSSGDSSATAGSVTAPQDSGVTATDGLDAPDTQAVLVPEAGESVSNDMTQLRIHLTDAPNPAIESAVVTIDSISVHTTGEAPFNVLSEPRTLDLLDYQNGLTTLMGELELPAGKYTQLRLSVSDGVVVSEDEEYDVFVPSGSVRVNRPFDLCAGGETDLVFDFDALKSLRYNKGKDEFMLRPVVKIDSVESDCPTEIVDDQEGDSETVETYSGPTGWLSFVVPAVETELFDSLVTTVDDIRVHDQGIGQVSVLAEAYDIDLLEAERQLEDGETGEVMQTMMIPPFEVPAGDLDQVRLMLQPIVATDAEGRSISFALPEAADLEEDGLKFFDQIEVCEDALTVVRWEYAFDASVIDFEVTDSEVKLHPVVQGVNLVEECVAYTPPVDEADDSEGGEELDESEGSSESGGDNG
ncbi:DUF4382 domain-containing protein [Gilvimarinus sp. DA14]|uniref:DUF4382 domain-containing protein n=1 Tax=Gilvimarinus sp. DA14 TaxID=2956798 RepID=UPI0020B638B3|nr:DUF4382 domain-containing protein [Gilvimarinus sp. DA14]UTF59872.1 DUF4382 domain-containing protein [Gilvimarinus sp. DA14]